MHNLEKDYENKNYEKYIKILEKNGIENVREKIENMFILDYIIMNEDSIKRIDISLLDGLVEEFDNLLHKYQYIIKMSENRIYKLCVILSSRINKLREIIESNN